MVSPSSVSQISARVREFLTNNFNIKTFNESQVLSFKEFLQREYDCIPSKERIGKGMVYIVKIFAKVLYNFIKTENFNLSKKGSPPSYFLSAVLQLIETIEAGEDIDSLRLAIHLTANLARDSFTLLINKIETWALHETWEIQENACHPVMAGLKRDKTEVLKVLRKWTTHPNENLRRLVTESLRPKAAIKWLRDPDQNDPVLEILTKLNHDPSIYVRKSVGNNLKDLTKYMPEKILDLIEGWLGNQEQLDDQGRKNLLWTIYHALRWLKAKNPEYHDRIKKLVGENYILYYDEKKNRRALPPKKRKK